MLTTGSRMNGAEHVKDERTLPSRERCKEILEQNNYDIARWKCPVYGEISSRAHWIADHVLHHLDFPQGRR